MDPRYDASQLADMQAEARASRIAEAEAEEAARAAPAKRARRPAPVDGSHEWLAAHLRRLARA